MTGGTTSAGRATSPSWKPALGRARLLAVLAARPSALDVSGARYVAVEISDVQRHLTRTVSSPSPSCPTGRSSVS